MVGDKKPKEKKQYQGGYQNYEKKQKPYYNKNRNYKNNYNKREEGENPEKLNEIGVKGEIKPEEDPLQNEENQEEEINEKTTSEQVIQSEVKETVKKLETAPKKIATKHTDLKSMFK